MRDFGEAENLQVSRKGAADFVSQADLSAERTLKDELEYARPGWNMILEESGYIKGESSDAPTWIIDPLDGTTNFLHGIPHFAISIAVLDNKKLTAAGILDPIRDEFFFAELGKGAYLNDRRIRVSSRKQVESALFATGIPFLGRTTSEQERIFINQLNHVMPKCSYSVAAGAEAPKLFIPIK